MIYECTSSNDNLRNLACAYMDAKDLIIRKGFADEIDWQENIKINLITESDFLREAAWVILSAGMKEIVIRKLFCKISSAFLDWESAKIINLSKDQCKIEALKIFKHERKINAILHIAQIISENGFVQIINNITESGIDYLKTFPYIGPATSCHLAKNLGFDIVKPDRHLLRISKVCGYKTPNEFCLALSKVTGDNIKTIDIVVWRFATLNSNYINFFASQLVENINKQKIV